MELVAAGSVRSDCEGLVEQREGCRDGSNSAQGIFYKAKLQIL